MGSAAFADGVSYPGKATRISRKGPRSAKNKKTKKQKLLRLNSQTDHILFDDDDDDDNDDDDRFYTALFSALQQTHCARL